MTYFDRISQFEPVPAPPAWEVVAAAVRRKIDLGLFRPHDRLPAERELAGQMGVSRITVSQALALLRGEGLIRSAGRTGGTVVRPPRLRSEGDVLNELRHYESEIRRNCFWRIAVEPIAARLAAQNSSEADLEALDAALTSLERTGAVLQAARARLMEDRSADDYAAIRAQGEAALLDFRRQDNLFHLAIARAARDDRLYDLVELYRAEFFSMLGSALICMEFNDVHQEHRVIVKTLRCKSSPEKAEEAMRIHIASVEERIFQSLDREVVNVADPSA
jgi:DNA-binding FadR family transcriptional regulator